MFWDNLLIEIVGLLGGAVLLFGPWCLISAMFDLPYPWEVIFSDG